MKYTALLILLISLTTFGQEKDDAFFEKIEDVANPYISQIVRGDIEVFRDAKQPKDTWTYKELKQYKDSLENGAFIIRGRFIMPPGLTPNQYQVCEYAYTPVNKKYHYYYAVCSLVDTTEDEFKPAGQFLFTNRETLKKWWGVVFQYFESDKTELIPKDFLMPIPPPPPIGF